LLPYTDRHYQRIDDLLTQSFIVDYTLFAMDSAGITGGEAMDVNGVEQH
jgi:U3 small nucleolar RNA-associated protein 13